MTLNKLIGKMLTKTTGEGSRAVSNNCLFKRHSECWAGFKGVCECWCHSEDPEVLAAMRDAVTSLQEPTFDFENSLVTDAPARRVA